jgi:hypothetical protein
VGQVRGIEKREVHNRTPGVTGGIAEEDRVVKTLCDSFELALRLARRTKAAKTEQAFRENHFGIDPSFQEELDAGHTLLDRIRMHVNDKRMSAALFCHTRKRERTYRTGKL